MYIYTYIYLFIYNSKKMCWDLSRKDAPAQNAKEAKKAKNAKQKQQTKTKDKYTIKGLNVKRENNSRLITQKEQNKKLYIYIYIL